jgi:hypothetical protein
MALPWYASNPSGQIVYPTGIAASLSQIYLYNPSFALEQDAEIVEKMLRDPTIAGNLDHYQQLIVGHDYFAEPRGKQRGDRKLAQVMEELQGETEHFSGALYNLAAARFRGITWALLRPERRVLALGDGVPREWTVIARVRDVDNRRFRQSRVNSTLSGTSVVGADDPLRLARAEGQGAAAFGSQGVGPFRWEFHRGYDWRDSRSGWWVPIEAVAPEKLWISHVVDNSERGLGYGYGQLMEDLYYYFWAKQQVMKFWLQGMERWGQGLLVQRVKALLEGLPSGQQQVKMQQAVDNLRAIRTENLAAIDANDELQLLDMPGNSERSLRDALDYYDVAITRRILFGVRPTGGESSSGGGSFSQAKVEESSTESAVAFARAPLEETWTRHVWQYLMDDPQNKQNLRELGLEGYACPRLRLRGREVYNLDAVLKLFEMCARNGVPVRREDFYNMTSLTQPNEEDELITFSTGGGVPLLGGGVGSVRAFGEPELVEKGPDLTEPRDPVGAGGTSVAEASAGGTSAGGKNRLNGRVAA